MIGSLVQSLVRNRRVISSPVTGVGLGFRPLQFLFNSKKSLSQSVNGSALIDSSGNGHNAALVDSNCVSFNGVDSYVSMSSGLQTTGSFSVSIWAKPTNIAGFNSTYGAGLIKSTNSVGAVGDFIVGIDSTGKVHFYNWRNTGADVDGRNVSNYALSDDTIYHIACVWDGATNKIYINGVESSLTTPVSTSSGWLLENCIGTGYSPSSSYCFKGDVWDARIYHIALSEAEIQSIYSNQTILGSEYFHAPMTEGAGATVYDVTGSSNHGTATTQLFSTQDLFHYNMKYGFRSSGGVKIPALPDGSGASDGNAITNIAGSWHNGAETKINLNPGGNADLIAAGVAANYTVEFGDDFTIADPPWNYKREAGGIEQDYILMAVEPSAKELSRINSYLRG